MTRLEEVVWQVDSYSPYFETAKCFFFFNLMLISLFPNLMHSFISFSPLSSVRKIGVISEVKQISRISKELFHVLICDGS